MSWSFNKAGVDAGNVREELGEAMSGLVFENDEMSAQATELIDIIDVLVNESCVLGAEVMHFNVALSGHANEGHANKSGWSNSMVNISLSKVD